MFLYGCFFFRIICLSSDVFSVCRSSLVVERVAVNYNVVGSNPTFGEVNDTFLE